MSNQRGHLCWPVSQDLFAERQQPQWPTIPPPLTTTKQQSSSDRRGLFRNSIRGWNGRDSDYNTKAKVMVNVLDFDQLGGLAHANLRTDNCGRGGWTPGDLASTDFNGRGNGPFASVDTVVLRLVDKMCSRGSGRDGAQALVFSTTPPSSLLANP